MLLFLGDTLGYIVRKVYGIGQVEKRLAQYSFSVAFRGLEHFYLFMFLVSWCTFLAALFSVERYEWMITSKGQRVGASVLSWAFCDMDKGSKTSWDGRHGPPELTLLRKGLIFLVQIGLYFLMIYPRNQLCCMIMHDQVAVNIQSFSSRDVAPISDVWMNGLARLGLRMRVTRPHTCTLWVESTCFVTGYAMQVWNAADHCKKAMLVFMIGIVGMRSLEQVLLCTKPLLSLQSYYIPRY